MISKSTQASLPLTSCPQKTPINVPPQPQKEPPRPPQLSQPTKPKKKRSPEEIEQRKKRVAEKEKAIADLEEKIRNLKLEIEKSKAELSYTTKKASIVTKATQTQSTSDTQSHVTKMREVFSSNQSVNQVQSKILGQVFKYENEIFDYYRKDSQKSSADTAPANPAPVAPSPPSTPSYGASGTAKGKTLAGSPASPLAKSSPAITQKPKSPAPGTSPPANKAGTIKIIRAAPLPPGYEAPQAPSQAHHSKQKSIQRNLSTIIDEKNKISVTFINPKPYSEKNASKY